MTRLRNRAWWFLFLIVGGIGAFFAGNWFFEDAICPRLQAYIVIVSSSVFTTILLFHAFFTKDNSFFHILLTLGLAVGVPLLISSLSGPILNYTDLKSAFCKGCDQVVVQANGLKSNGENDAAEAVLRQCLKDNPHDVGANELLAHILFKSSQIAINNAPPCSPNIGEVLDEAYERTGDPSFQIAIDSERHRYLDKCATPLPPTEAPPTVQIIQKRIHQNMATVDFKILRSGNEVTGLSSKDFKLKWNGQSIPIAYFEERSSDDPVCIIVLVDNSQSVSPGREQIKQAISNLNNNRKPDDEFGMVTFGDPNRVKIVQNPSKKSLNPDFVTTSESTTALWDGVLMGLEAAQSCKSDHKYLITLTDGADNSSNFSKGDLEADAEAIGHEADLRNISICPVGVASSNLKEEPLKILSRGCSYYPASNFDAVASLFENIIGYVRSFYRVQFTPLSDSTILRVLDTVEVPIDFNQ